MNKRTSCFFIFFLSLPFLMRGQEENLDLAMIQKIREEGLGRSQVMDIAFYLTDVNGPRLQGSPGFLKAAEWSRNKMCSWGLVNATLEPWGESGKGWELEKCYVALANPYYKPIIAFPKAWTGGSNGLKSCEVIYVNAKDTFDLKSLKENVSGKIILLKAAFTLETTYQPDARRFTEPDLKKMSDHKPLTEATRGGVPGLINRINAGGWQMQMIDHIKAYLKKKGAVAVLRAGSHGRDGTIFVSHGGLYATRSPENMLDIVIPVEDYNTIFRLVKKSIPVKMELEVQTHFDTTDTKGYNVIAEIPGTDSLLAEQVVMVGAHLDSWHASTGATDNAAGCAVMMEALRIIKAVGIRPRRTIRIALWGGEEQGLVGSANYVYNHFVDTRLKRLNKEGEKVSVYFNLDYGTGKIRGIYAQGNVAVKPIFHKWLQPFHDLGASVVTLESASSTDHSSFDRVNIPAFQFIQDPVEYNNRTHHTNIDSYDHLQPDDLKQAATIIAAFVFHAAQRDEMMPGK